MVVVHLVPREEVAEPAVVELHERARVEGGHPLVQVDEQLADGPEVGAAEDRDRVLRAPHRAPGGRGVAETQMPALVVGDPALLVAEQDEPPDRDVPRALVDERDGVRVASAMFRQLAARVPCHLLRNDAISELELVGFPDRQHRGQHPELEPVWRHVGAPVDDADLRVLAVGGSQEAHALAGPSVQERGPERSGGSAQEVPLPVQLFVPLEPVERLEHPEEGAGDHRVRSLARGGVTYPVGPLDRTAEGDRWRLRSTGEEATPTRLLAPDGSAVGPTGVGLEPDQLRAMLRWMLLARRLDGECIALQRQGELTVYPGFEGQEAAQIGAAFALAEQDFVFPTFRELALAIVRGVDPVRYLWYHRGTWHGGPYDPRATRFGPIAIPIATQIPHAAGYALGQQLDGTDVVTLACFGDGATSEGDFHEAANLAGVWRLPLVLFCQNNGWAISVPTASADRGRDLAPRRGLRLPRRSRRRQRRARRVRGGARRRGPGSRRRRAHVDRGAHLPDRRALDRRRRRPLPDRRRRGSSTSLRSDHAVRDVDARGGARGRRPRWPRGRRRPGRSRCRSAKGWSRSRRRRMSGRSTGSTRTRPSRSDASVRRRSVAEWTMSGALNRALWDALAGDARVLVFGEDVGVSGGVFRVTAGLQEEFGDRRVFDTPISEAAIAGAAVGLCFAEWRPVDRDAVRRVLLSRPWSR